MRHPSSNQCGSRCSFFSLLYSINLIQHLKKKYTCLGNWGTRTTQWSLRIHYINVESLCGRVFGLTTTSTMGCTGPTGLDGSNMTTAPLSDFLLWHQIPTFILQLLAPGEKGGKHQRERKKKIDRRGKSKIIRENFKTIIQFEKHNNLQSS